MKVYNLTSSKSGKAVANQFAILDGAKTYFQSYESICCIVDGEQQKIIFGKDWDYSRTTVKYLCQFLRGYAPVVDFEWSSNEIRKLFESGTMSSKFDNTWSIEYRSYLA